MANDHAGQATIRPAAISAARGILGGASHLMTWVGRGRRVDPGASPVQLNLGSALAVAPGWVHIDSSPNALVAGRGRRLQALAYRFSGSNAHFEFEEYRRRLNQFRFVHYDLGHGIPFADGTVDFVYSSHFLEHLDRQAGLHLLHESHRVLRSGGIIRVCVPDLETAVRFYLDGNRKRFLTYFFTDDRVGRHRHRFMYDFELLKEALTAAGFIDIVRQQFQVGRTPDLDRLDNRSDETLYVEAVRH